MLWAATIDPDMIGEGNPAVVQNLVAGEWETSPKALHPVPDPLTGEVRMPSFLVTSATSVRVVHPGIHAQMQLQ